MAATATAAADRWQEGGGDQINQIIAGAELIRGVWLDNSLLFACWPLHTTNTHLYLY